MSRKPKGILSKRANLIGEANDHVITENNNFNEEIKDIISEVFTRIYLLEIKGSNFVARLAQW